MLSQASDVSSDSNSDCEYLHSKAEQGINLSPNHRAMSAWIVWTIYCLCFSFFQKFLLSLRVQSTLRENCQQKTYFKVSHATQRKPRPAKFMCEFLFSRVCGYLIKPEISNQ